MEDLKKYIKNLDYSYIITYSGLRGKLMEELVNNAKDEIIRLEEEKKEARYMEGLKINKRIRSIKEEINLSTSILIDEKGNKHKSAEEISELNESSENLKMIIKNLELRVRNEAYALCIPVYRDSLVFCNKKSEIRGILYICFCCNSIMDERRVRYRFDNKALANIKSVLIKLGHQIE